MALGLVNSVRPVLGFFIFVERVRPQSPRTWGVGLDTCHPSWDCCSIRVAAGEVPAHVA